MKAYRGAGKVPAHAAAGAKGGDGHFLAGGRDGPRAGELRGSNCSIQSCN